MINLHPTLQTAIAAASEVTVHAGSVSVTGTAAVAPRYSDLLVVTAPGGTKTYVPVARIDAVSVSA